MNNLKKIIFRNFNQICALVVLFLSIGYRNPSLVLANNDDTLYPQFIEDIINEFKGNEAGYINDRVQMGLTALFVVVFIVAIAYSALAANKVYDKSGGIAGSWRNRKER